MKNKIPCYNFFIFSIIYLSLIFGCSSSNEEARLKNIIIFISDGCGYNQIEATDFWEYGEIGRQVYEQFPLKIAMSTYSANGHGYDSEKAWNLQHYLSEKPTDSAASATALATGVKTNNGIIGMDVYSSRVVNVMEKAEKCGMSTGVVTSVQFTHATPAAFVAHNEHRNHYAEIAKEMILESKIDVIMGCGHPYYNENGEQVDSTEVSFKYVGGQSTWNMLLKRKAGVDANGDSTLDFWTLIQNKEDFEQLRHGKTPPRVIGIPKVYSTLQQERAGDPKADPYVVPFIQSVPSLETMTEAALNILDENKKGFLLMVEGGAVDWACHDNQSGRMIEEQIGFNKSISAAVKWVEKNSSWEETLMIVTGDHETGYLTGPDSVTGQEKCNIPITNPIQNNGKHKLPGMVWRSGSHTNSLIPFFTKGVASQLFDEMADESDLIRGKYIDNTEIAKVIFRAIDSVNLNHSE